MVPTVRFDPANITDSVRDDLRKNIELLADLGPEKRLVIFEAAFRAITAGGALNVLFDALIAEGVTRNRAKEISLSLGTKSRALMERDRQAKLGIEYAIWRYSGAPCGGRDKAHKAADGQRYKLNEGLLVNGKYTWPGREDNCKCSAKPVILGVDD